MDKKIVKLLKLSSRGLTARGIKKRLKANGRSQELEFSSSLRNLVLNQKVIWTVNHRFKLNEDL